MKLILIAITIALLGGCLNALPAGHLRFERSTEAKAGTTVTIDKAAPTKDAAATQTKTVESKEPLKIEDALTLVKQTVQKLESDNSAAAAPQTTKTESAAPKTETAAAAKKEEKAESSISSSASIISVPQGPILGSVDTNDEATFSAYSQKYVNKYGDVLNRINQDKVQQLASNRRSLFDRKGYSSSRRDEPSSYGGQDTKTLSSMGYIPQKQGVSNSVSRVFMNGFEMDGKNLAPHKKQSLTPQSRYSVNPYGESIGLLSRQQQEGRNIRPTGQWNNVRVLSFQPQNVPMRYL